MQTDGRPRAVQVARQLALVDPVAQRFGDALITLNAQRLHALAQAEQLTGVFALVTQDVVGAVGLRLAGQARQCFDQQFTHAAQRVRLVLALAGTRQFLERQAQTFEHGLEQVDLVLEMPVNGAAADAGFFRHLGQRRTGNALGMEHPLGGIEYLYPRRLRFFFGSSGHLST